MKPKKLTKDEFARFISGVTLNEIENYNFDVMYDIHKIVYYLKVYQGMTEELKTDTFHFMIRKTGCDLVQTNHEYYDTFKQRSEIIYSLEFNWNHDYFDVPFCTVTKISK